MARIAAAIISRKHQAVKPSNLKASQRPEAAFGKQIELQLTTEIINSSPACLMLIISVCGVMHVY